MSAEGTLPATVFLDGRGFPIATTSGARGWVGEDPGNAEGSRLRFGPDPLDWTRAHVRLGWVEDDQGRRLPVRAEVVPVAGGSMVLLASPGEDSAYPALHRSIIHDLRSPMATALLLSQTLGVELASQGGQAAELGVGYLPRFEQELSRLATMIGLVRLLRVVGRPPSGASDLPTLVAAALRRHSRALQRDGISVRHTPGSPVQVFTESETVHALVGALLTVAVEGGGRAEGWIQCRTGISQGAPFVEFSAAGLQRLNLDLALGPPGDGHDRASWLEVGLMIAAWVARREGGDISHGTGPEPGAIALTLRLPAP